MNHTQSPVVKNKLGKSVIPDAKMCCGCGACFTICPQKAITIREDVNGYMLCGIDENRCINCGLCIQVCPIQGPQNVQHPLEAFAACNQNLKERKRAASGGIFTAIASVILKQGGIVWGAAYDSNRCDHVVHMNISNITELERLQGSKYVQSDTTEIYNAIKNELETDKNVLFSGTPCQVSALKNFLKKNYEKLFTIDIICHGVPNAKMFHDYIHALEKIYNGQVDNFSFRDKAFGWGMNASVTIITPFGKKRKVVIPSKNSSYFDLFLQAKIYRESCYHCPYAQMGRVGDITIGDYWGIEKEHPDFLKKKEINEEDGISCILINSQKGKVLFEKSKHMLQLYDTVPEKIAAHNGQLKASSKKPNNYDEILNRIHLDGFIKLQYDQKKRLGIRYWVNIIKARIPTTIKRKIRKLLFKIKASMEDV